MSANERPCELTVQEAARALAAGRLTAVQLLYSCLEQIERHEPQVHAWALVDREGALRAAGHLDVELRQGKRRGPLHGIPVGVKDIFYTEGLRTEAGSRSWSGFVPTYDATAVSRLREAGAVLVGKTHTAEFAFTDAPPTRNPWNVAHSPGGSSSGSAAGVAARMCLAALGTQTGGSTLRPAAYNGIVGFKPEYGRISTYGVVPEAWSIDTVGILTRTVTDAALVFMATAGYDPQDVHSIDEAVPDCATTMDAQSKPRLGLVREYFFEHADGEMQHHTEEVAEVLCRAGAEVEEVRLPSGFEELNEVNGIIASVEAAAYHRDMFLTASDRYGPGISGLIERGLALDGVVYADALQRRLQWRARLAPLLAGFDALLTPGATDTAPDDPTNTGDPIMYRPWTTVGVPGIALPTGLARNGLPVGIQLVGRSMAERDLLTVAHWCERVLDIHLRPPLD